MTLKALWEKVAVYTEITEQLQVEAKQDNLENMATSRLNGLVDRCGEVASTFYNDVESVVLNMIGTGADEEPEFDSLYRAASSLGRKLDNLESSVLHYLIDREAQEYFEAIQQMEEYEAEARAAYWNSGEYDDDYDDTVLEY